MKRTTLLVSLLLAALMLLTSCGGAIFDELDDSTADVFCRTFIDHIVHNEKEETYALVRELGSRAGFESMWETLRKSAEGASSVDIHMTNFWFFTRDGVDYFKGQYFVEYDNGSCMNLSLTFEEAKDIVEIKYLDITEFITDARPTADTLSLILGIYSLLVLAFTVWMIVDCVRRRMLKKPLWIIVILLCFSLTVLTGGKTLDLSFMVGLCVQASRATINYDYPAIATRILLPVGAILYFFLRKRLTLPPRSPRPPRP